MLQQKDVPLGFTDKNGVYWCAVKGRACASATAWGQCSMTACRNYNLNNHDYSKTEANSLLPDELIINGLKYRRVIDEC